MNNCPICNSDKCVIKVDTDFNGTKYLCNTFGYRFRIQENIINNKDINNQKLYAMIYELLSENKSLGRIIPIEFYFDSDKYDLGFEHLNDCDRANAYYLLKQFPIKALDKLYRGFKNIANRFNVIGDRFNKSSILPVMVYCTKQDYAKRLDEKDELVNMLAELNYLYQYNTSYFTDIKITVKGWQVIDSMDKGNSKYAFIAMKFGDDTKKIREAIKLAIINSGYFPYIMDEIEHNKQIVPEILSGIEKSLFLVAEISNGNLGAYYESGYAQGLGKEVIVVCSKDVFKDNKVHFDFAQKSIILYENSEELVDLLKKRIEATIVN